MIEYEYKILRAENHQVTKQQLDRFGGEGWELVTILKAEDDNGGYLYYFKRPRTRDVVG